jgi:hypothetical protein
MVTAHLAQSPQPEVGGSPLRRTPRAPPRDRHQSKDTPWLTVSGRDGGVCTNASSGTGCAS